MRNFKSFSFAQLYLFQKVKKKERKENGRKEKVKDYNATFSYLPPENFCYGIHFKSKGINLAFQAVSER